MVPNKHYAASEIEEVLKEEESAAVENMSETFAEERTIQRWKKFFSKQLSISAGRLEEIAEKMGMNIAKLKQLSDKPLARLYRIVEILQELPSAISKLGYSFCILLSHPVCLG